jgi:hypothetical protein
LDDERKLKSPTHSIVEGDNGEASSHRYAADKYRQVLEAGMFRHLLPAATITSSMKRAGGQAPSFLI